MTTFGERTRQLMAERGVSLRELAKRVPVDAGHLSRVMNGHKRPSARLAERVDVELGAHGELVALREADAPASSGSTAATPGSAGAILGRSAEHGLHGSPAQLEEILVRLRDQRQGGVSRVVHALDVTQGSHVPGVGSGAVDDLNCLVDYYRRTFRNVPPSELYGEILGVRAWVGSRLNGMATPTERPDLFVTAGWLSNLLALVTHDLGDRAATLVWCADAERCGREVGHRELTGWAAQTRVLMSFYDGHAREAVIHAQRGQKCVPPGTVAHAKLLAQEMRAWALLGDARMVSITRRRAENAIAKLSTSAPTGDVFSISLAEDPPYTATALLLLGRFQEAADATRRVIATFYDPRAHNRKGEHPSGFARTYLILALALAGLGELDEAHAAGGLALQAPRLVWPVAVLARKLDRALMRDFAGTAEAGDYHDRYVTAMRYNPGGCPPNA